MKAMILAAGLGTRLRPITDDRPKALITVAGRTLLEIAIRRLQSFGVNEVIVNTHHFAAMIVETLAAHHNFGMRIELSPEEILLDTGGGLKRAAWFFLEDNPPSNPPFILHNVDVLNAIDLRRMVQFHLEHEALATLAVQQRETSRALLFDEARQLCGRRSGPSAGNTDTEGKNLQVEMVRPVASAQALGFSGIHVISPRLFAKMHEEGAFSIISTYLRLAAQGEKILAFRADGYAWRDLGRREDLDAAEREFATGRFGAI
jgi:NDP-sugar pyrophosphorylase family protein